MNKFLTAVLLLCLAGCSDEITERYDTWEDASRANAVVRGWIPDFVPDTALKISDTHNLDTNAQFLTFHVSPSEIPRMVSGLQKLAGQDATRAFRLVEREKEQHIYPATWSIHLTCGENASGGLFVNSTTGRADYYRSTEWYELCPQL